MPRDNFCLVLLFPCLKIISDRKCYSNANFHHRLFTTALKCPITSQRPLSTQRTLYLPLAVLIVVGSRFSFVSDSALLNRNIDELGRVGKLLLIVERCCFRLLVH